MDWKAKLIVGLVAGAILTLSGLVYASLDDRVKENRNVLQTIVPILYRIEAKVERNGQDIQKLLEQHEDPSK